MRHAASGAAVHMLLLLACRSCTLACRISSILPAICLRLLLAVWRRMLSLICPLIALIVRAAAHTPVLLILILLLAGVGLRMCMRVPVSMLPAVAVHVDVLPRNLNAWHAGGAVAVSVWVPMRLLLVLILVLLLLLLLLLLVLVSCACMIATPTARLALLQRIALLVAGSGLLFRSARHSSCIC